MRRLDEYDPIAQLVLISIAVAVACVFPASVVLQFTVPNLGRPLFVPIAAAFFCGTFAFLVEKRNKQNPRGLLGFAMALLVFPGLALTLLILLRIPYDTRAADFVSLLPQAVFGRPFFDAYRSRFHATA